MRYLLYRFRLEYLICNLAFNLIKIIWCRDYQGAFLLGKESRYKYGRKITKIFQEQLTKLLENKDNKPMTDDLKIISIKVLAGLKSDELNNK